MPYTVHNPMPCPPQDCPSPSQRGGHWFWQSGSPKTSILFVGRGRYSDRRDVLAAVSSEPPADLAWTKQIHSDQFVDAVEGFSGEGDALTTTKDSLALSVATADCVPIVLVGGTNLAVIHAGWRGIASNIATKTMEALNTSPTTLEAWIGPSIGPCCYEVGPEVADRVAAASCAEVVCDRGLERPTIDLAKAVKTQLTAAGMERIHTFECCTHCNDRWLWSFRRRGPAAGRNLTFAWLQRN
jgi:YfiH family protein